MKGTIKTLRNGYGFIIPEDGSPDRFFHAEALKGVAFADLREGATVTFEPGQSEKGPNAENVEIANE